jgi:GTP pyrophosphokinase
MRLQRKEAHYKYKNGATQEGGLDVWLNLLKEAKIHKQSAVDFVEDFKMNLYSKEIYVFTQGDILTKEQLHWTSPLAYIQK